MNNLIVNSNKELCYKGSTLLYRGEADFEQLRVVIPQKIGKRKMADWLTDITLVVLTPSQSYSVALTFEPSDIHKGYISQVIDVPETWCQYTGILKMYVQFDNSSELGVTNAVDIEVKANVDEETPIPVDEFARKSYVDNADGALEDRMIAYDATAVHKTGDETIEGVKTFQKGEAGGIRLNYEFEGGCMFLFKHLIQDSRDLVLKMTPTGFVLYDEHNPGHYGGLYFPVPEGVVDRAYDLTLPKKAGTIAITDDLLPKADDSAVVHKAEVLASGENITIEQTGKTGIIRFTVPNYMSYSGGIQVCTTKTNTDSNQWTRLSHYALHIHFASDNVQAGDVYQLNMQHKSIVLDRKGGGQYIIDLPMASGTLVLIGHNPISTQGDGIILDDADGDGQVVISPRGGSGHQGSVDVLDSSNRAYMHPDSLVICGSDYSSDDAVEMNRETGGESKVVVKGLGSSPGSHRFSTSYKCGHIEFADLDDSATYVYGFPRKSGTLAFMESTVPRVLETTLPPVDAISESYDVGTFWYYIESSEIKRMFVCVATAHGPGYTTEHVWAEIPMTPYTGT